ncbi:carboxymuconolactone decarboxylase family protein [Staphylococcus succinus]|uniref:Alkylhydroperoxidase n=3 Tax=Staphylococcus succinus TaxID=61015 RepID=A0A9Q6MVA0_9STAP|nr:alkylhydroperoxidase [Staphylococcus succinus]MEB8126286.1 carboxymuconolactone decarboxylase family protein [Staphylococcus succinus]MEB8209671.1 carboxymuconolactone decarboxylase family protein [Staphylococcus succinus]PTI75405.1 alkylhydroperoxidase [Staphylococcus succinus]PTJ14687.1 alkylhydroperoxidase [Staphylococcus succinus]RIN27494.1 carboxymuconolactone decarboxylase family protein [Staphylococcus succinus]
MTIIQPSLHGETSFQRLLGYNEEVMKNWRDLSDILECNGALSSELKEEIRRMLAQQNGCLYCKAKGKPKGHLKDNKSAVCLGFTDVFLKLNTDIPDYIINILQDNLTNNEISELIAFITFTTSQQYFGALMKLSPNDEKI